jgi:hypothetical protein
VVEEGDVGVEMFGKDMKGMPRAFKLLKSSPAVDVACKQQRLAS